MGCSAHGGAIFSAGTLTVSSISISGSSVFGGGPGGPPGGSFNSVAANAGDASGGAIESTGLTENHGQSVPRQFCPSTIGCFGTWRKTRWRRWVGARRRLSVFWLFRVVIRDSARQ